jgi:hypothetical protein
MLPQVQISRSKFLGGACRPRIGTVQWGPKSDRPVAVTHQNLYSKDSNISTNSIVTYFKLKGNIRKVKVYNLLKILLRKTQLFVSKPRLKSNSILKLL